MVPVRKLARVGSAAEPLAEQGPQVRQPQGYAAQAARRLGGGAHPLELALHLAGLPRVGGAHEGQRADTLAEDVEPLVQRPAADQAVGHRPQPVDVLGDAAGQVDLTAADVVEREGAVEPGVGVVGERDAGQDAVEAELPGVGHHSREPELLAVLGVEGPVDPGRADPVGELDQVVVAEPEPSADRLGVGQVDHVTGAGPAAGQVEEGRGDAEDGVGLGQRPVGELDAQPVGRVAVAARRCPPRPKPAEISGA